MSVLKLWRDGSQVQIRVETRLNGGTVFPLSFETGRAYVADLLLRYFSDLLTHRMKDIRADAYAQGWADAKAKRAKETWFSGELP